MRNGSMSEGHLDHLVTLPTADVAARMLLPGQVEPQEGPVALEEVLVTQLRFRDPDPLGLGAVDRSTAWDVSAATSNSCSSLHPGEARRSSSRESSLMAPL